MEKKIPFDFWFHSNSSIAFSYNPLLEAQKNIKLINDDNLVNFIKNNKINIFQICDCSDDETYAIIKKRKEILNDPNTPKDHKEL